MDVMVQLGLELTDAQADYSAFSGHMTSGPRPTLLKGWTVWCFWQVRYIEYRKNTAHTAINTLYSKPYNM